MGAVIRACFAGVVCVLASGACAGFLLLAGVIRPSPRVWALATVIWARVVLWACGARLNVEGREQISAGAPFFFVGNHQAAIDIPIILAGTGGDVRFLAKRSLFRIPVFGWALWQYGLVSVDRSDARSAARAVDLMLQRLARSPTSMIVFPEGTRSPNGRLLPFRRGAMKICRRAGLPVVPFSIDGSYRVNPRHGFRIVPGPVRLTFGRPVPAGQVASMSATELHDQVRAAIERQLGESHGPETRPQD